MTIEQILPFTQQVTYVGDITILYFNDDKEWVGYFDDNFSMSPLVLSNKWNFVLTPKDNNSKTPTIINGEDLRNIKILKA